MEWISVKDRLPEQYGKYLVYMPGELTSSMHVSRYMDSIQKFRGAQSHSIFEGITHWMPLPEPPKYT